MINRGARVLRPLLASFVLAAVAFAACGRAEGPGRSGDRGQGSRTGSDATADPVSRMDAYLAAAHKLDRFSGSVLVARGGKIVLAKGYGMANYELDVPNTPETKFRLGSVTKQFTAMAIMQLEEKGKLKVTDTIRAILPDYPPTGDKVTIHHLLTHTSGVPNFTELPDYPKTMTLPSTPQQTIARVKDKPLEFTPGEKFVYSNSNYVILGAIIEKASGQTYEDYLREHIFSVIGMADTGYDHYETVLKGRASGYEFPGDKMANAPYVDMSIPFAAGGLYSTVNDLYKWDRALYTDKLLSKAGRARMFTPFKGGYAYGWMTGEVGGHRSIRHGGGINGFITDIARYPDDDACVIVLCNFINGYVGETSDSLAKILFGQAVEPPQATPSIKLPASVLDSYAGRYKLEGTPVIFTVLREGETLYVQVAGQPRTSLLAQSETKFFMKNLGFYITFFKDGKGRVTHFVLLQGKRETKAVREE